MSSTLRVHGFETSNNFKVRIALGHKELPYHFLTIDPEDRSGIVELSGQHLTPVLEHGDRVLFDSAAILRYLDANFAGTPRLFGESRDEQWAIEDLELYARTELAGPMMALVHLRVSGGDVDEKLMEDCTQAFAEAVQFLVEDLEDRTWLFGDSMTAADITAASVLYRVRESGLLPIPEEGKSLDPWIERVLAYDGIARLD